MATSVVMSSSHHHHSSNQYIRRAPASYLRAHPSTWKEGGGGALGSPRLSRAGAVTSPFTSSYRDNRSLSRDVVTIRERTPYSSATGARSPRDRSWDGRGTTASPLERRTFVFPRQTSEGGSSFYGARLGVGKPELRRQEEVSAPASPAIVQMRQMIASLSVEGEEDEEDEEEEGEYSEEEVSIAVPVMQLQEVPKKKEVAAGAVPAAAPPEPAVKEDEKKEMEVVDEEEDKDEDWDEDEEEDEEEVEVKPPPPPVPPKPAPVVQQEEEEELDEEEEWSEEEEEEEKPEMVAKTGETRASPIPIVEVTRTDEPSVVSTVNIPVLVKEESFDEEEEEDEDEEWDEDEDEEEVPEVASVPASTVPISVLIVPRIASVIPPTPPNLEFVESEEEEEEDEGNESEEPSISVSLRLSNIRPTSSLPDTMREEEEEEGETSCDEDEEEEEEQVQFKLDLEDEVEEQNPSCSRSLGEVLFFVDAADRRVLLRLLQREGAAGRLQAAAAKKQLESAGIWMDEEEEEEMVDVVEDDIFPDEEEDEDWEEEEEDEAPSTSGVCDDEDEEEWEDGDGELLEYCGEEEWSEEGFQSTTSSPSGGGGVGRTTSFGGTTRDGLSATSVSRVAPRVATTTAAGAGGSATAAAAAAADRNNGTTAPFAAPTISSTAAANVNYRLLYEKERTENERLRREMVDKNGVNELNGSTTSSTLSAVRRVPSRLTSTPSSVGGVTRSPSGGSMDDAERRTFERRITDLELELKSLGQLRLENQRLKEENGALVRVISKMTI